MLKIKLINQRFPSINNIPKSVVYTGSKIEPYPYLTIVNRDGGEVTLKRNVDYTVGYRRNRNIGTATVIIRGVGNYSGTLKRTFKIVSVEDYAGGFGQ